MPEPCCAKREQGQENADAQREEETSENGGFPFSEAGQDIRIGDNEVACFPENPHLLIDFKIGEANVKGGDDLGCCEPEKNDEGGAKRNGMPNAVFDRINRI